jgi:hypothetical protein
MCTIYISLLKKSSDQSVCVSYTKNKLGLNVCEWLLFNAKGVAFHLYHNENKLHFDEMMMMSTLY